MSNVTWQEQVTLCVHYLYIYIIIKEELFLILVKEKLEGIDMETALLSISNTQLPTWATWVTIVFGILSCFLGYKLIRVWMAFVGFVIGMSLGYVLSINHVSNVAIAILIGFVVGVLFGLIAYKVYMLGVFIIAFVTSFAFVGQLVAYFNEPGWLWLAVTIVLALVAAGMSLKFVKPVVIIATALNGAVTVMMGLFRVMNIDAAATMLLASLLLAVLGMMVQFFTNKGKSD